MNKRSRFLHEQFKKHGALAKKYRQQCLGMVPEIYKLRVFEEKGFDSIYEYAAKLAGISRLQVDTILRLEIKFKDKPNLRKALVCGEISHHKLARVASIATNKNDAELVEKTKTLPQKALETFVRDERNFQKMVVLSQPLFDQKSLRAQTLKLDEDVENKLSELQQKGIDINEELRDFLQKREQEIEQEKEELSINAKPTKSTYINVRTKRILKKKYGTRCSINNCQKPATQLHHTQRFALTKTHDPHYLAPLCKEHHQIAHSIDIKYQRKTKDVEPL